MERASTLQESFRSEKRFQDIANFPYGFSKSGDFTITQANMLELNGLTYLALAKGEKQPQTPLEREFVAFCQGQKDAESDHERVWKRYVTRVGRNSNAVSFNKKRTSQTSYYDDDEMGDDAIDGDDD